MRFSIELYCIYFIGIAILCNDQALSQEVHKPPNIVWLVVEDQSPQFFSFYGDPTINLPNLESLAKDALIFDRAYAPVPVCAPARSAIITGMYPTSLGTHNMRTYNQYNPQNESEIGIPSYSPVVPPDVKVFTHILQQTGYYCSNNAKEDYNFKTPEQTWNDSGPTAHWGNRNDDRPFFSVFNFGDCHESGIWRFQDSTIYVPESEVIVPPYFPDTQIVRHDLAVNYSNLKRIDDQIGIVIDQLKEEGLYDNSYVFFFSDHGGPFPRHKRAIYETGIRVPFLIKFPNSVRAGNRTDQLLSFIDLAPTTLSIAGIEPPEHMQGEPLFGTFASEKDRNYLFASSDRFDEVTDRLRAVISERFKYIRSYNPSLPHALPVSYRYQMPMMQELDRLNKDGRLSSDQQNWFLSPKPREELYDLENDPWELNNLAAQESSADTLVKYRAVLDSWIKSSGDLGEVAEKELLGRWLENGRQQKLASPEIRKEGSLFTIFHPRTDATLLWKRFSETAWKIYPSEISFADDFQIKAIRIGFEDSEIVEFHSED